MKWTIPNRPYSQRPVSVTVVISFLLILTLYLCSIYITMFKNGPLEPKIRAVWDMSEIATLVGSGSFAQKNGKSVIFRTKVPNLQGWLGRV